MRRSWVLADGERKRLTAIKTNNKSPDPGSGVSGSSPDPANSLLTMFKEESEQIHDYLEKMTMIRNQTEDMNPEVRYFFNVSTRASFIFYFLSFLSTVKKNSVASKIQTRSIRVEGSYAGPYTTAMAWIRVS